MRAQAHLEFYMLLHECQHNSCIIHELLDCITVVLHVYYNLTQLQSMRCYGKIALRVAAILHAACGRAGLAHPHGIKVPDALANQLRFRGRDGRLKVAALYTFHAQRRSREIGGPDAGWLPLWGTCRNPRGTPAKTPSHESAARPPHAPEARPAPPATAPPSAPSSRTRLYIRAPIHSSRYTPTIRSTTSR